MRRFHLVRNEDLSGVSGTGTVAEGVLLHTGQVVICWLGHLHSVAVYESIPVMEAIHGHEGRTSIRWIDPEA